MGKIMENHGKLTVGFFKPITDGPEPLPGTRLPPSSSSSAHALPSAAARTSGLQLRPPHHHEPQAKGKG